MKKLEDELGKTKVENSELVFELKVAKTKIAVLEEKLANMEVGALEKGGQQKMNKVKVTINSTNYGCFGLSSFGSLKVNL